MDSQTGGYNCFYADLEAFEYCLNQNAWVAAYFAGLDIGADDAGGFLHQDISAKETHWVDERQHLHGLAE